LTINIYLSLGLVYFGIILKRWGGPVNPVGPGQGGAWFDFPGFRSIMFEESGNILNERIGEVVRVRAMSSSTWGF
jgi:hypothetical protein